MKQIIIDTLLDAVKIFPFLIVTFFIMEFIEHKFSKKSRKKIIKAGKFGPIIGGILGAVPQCGFSVMATNLYATRIISIGTLMAIYLSTSDEMLPVIISQGAPFSVIFQVVSFKVIIGITCGFIIDFILKSNVDEKVSNIKDYCEENNCDCKHGIFKSSIKHTFNILFFIVTITFLLNTGIFYLGENNISKLFLKDSFFAPFVSSLIGLIPNCGASVILTELYLSGVISFSSCIAGLLTGSGVAILVLFKVNKDKKDNLRILAMLYLIGSLIGVTMQIINALL